MRVSHHRNLLNLLCKTIPVVVGAVLFSGWDSAAQPLQGYLVLQPDTRTFPTVVVLRRKPVVVVRGLIPGLRFESNNPQFQVEQPEGEPGVYRLTFEPRQTYLIQAVAPGYQPSIEKRFYFSNERDVQHWVVTSETIVTSRRAVSALYVTSTPEPVEVKIAGQPGRFRTPYTEPAMPPGTYTLVAKADSPYLMADTLRAEVGTEDTTHVVFELKRSQAGLSVATPPAGTRLSINGIDAFVFRNSKDGWAPVAGSKFEVNGGEPLVPSGKIVAGVRLEGYYTVSDTLVLSENARVEWNPALRKHAGTLRVSAFEPGIRLFLNGKDLGEVSQPVRFDAGEINLIARKANGQRTIERTFSVQKDSTVTWNIEPSDFSAHARSVRKKRIYRSLATGSVLGSAYLMYAILTRQAPGFPQPPDPPDTSLR
jgi:hypothetical protein